MSIAMVRTILVRSEKKTKLPAGPMARVIPGPMLERQLRAAVKLVGISTPSRDTTREKSSSREIYTVKKDAGEKHEPVVDTQEQNV